MVVGDFNASLSVPLTERDELIADLLDGHCLTDVKSHFRVRRRRLRGRWTWRQRRRGRMVRSKLDYFFMPEDIKKRVCRMGIRKPRHHHSDHRAVVTVFWGRDGGRLASYRKGRRQCPLR